MRKFDFKPPHGGAFAKVLTSAEKEAAVPVAGETKLITYTQDLRRAYIDCEVVEAGAGFPEGQIVVVNSTRVSPVPQMDGIVFIADQDVFAIVEGGVHA